MKKELKLYLNQQDFKSLKMKAESSGLIGRGWLCEYIRRVARSDIIFLDGNTRLLLNALNLKSK